MYKKILIATDGSEMSRKAAQHAVSLAKETGAALFVLTAQAQYPTFLYLPEVAAHLEQAMADHCRDILAGVEAMASAAGIPCEARLVLNQAPFQAILDLAAEEACDLIVLGSHGHSGVDALILGSVTQKVLARATVPVLVVR
jgi:nucleotide-binding universal stress UspA family protein